MSFYHGQLLITRPVIAIILGKAAICYCGWNGHREQTIWSRPCFVSIPFVKTNKTKSRKLLQQKSKRTRIRWCQWRTMVGRPRIFRWALQCQFRQFEKAPNFLVRQVLSYCSGDQLLYIEVQYMFTLVLICMQYLLVSIIHQTTIQTTGSLTCLHDLLMHAYSHVFAFFEFCKTAWRAGGGLGTFSFPFIWEGPWAPFCEILAPFVKSSRSH